MSNSNSSSNRDADAESVLAANGLPLEDLTLAKDAVAQAERAVDHLLATLGRAPRAEKVTVSAPLEAALQRLHDARIILDNLAGET